MAETIPHSLIKDNLTLKFGADIRQVEEEPLYNVLEITVNPARIVEILRYLFDSPEMGFQFLTSLFAINWPDRKDEEICVVYLLHSLATNTRIRLKAYIPVDNPTIDSATPVFATANWMERETYDFFGVNFKGHPDLKRILNVDTMDYFPMRKEYPLEEATRIDKDDTMFGRDKVEEGE